MKKYVVNDTILYGVHHPTDSKCVTIGDRVEVYLAAEVEQVLRSLVENYKHVIDEFKVCITDTDEEVSDWLANHENKLAEATRLLERLR